MGLQRVEAAAGMDWKHHLVTLGVICVRGTITATTLESFLATGTFLLGMKHPVCGCLCVQRHRVPVGLSLVMSESQQLPCVHYSQWYNSLHISMKELMSSYPAGGDTEPLGHIQKLHRVPLYLQAGSHFLHPLLGSMTIAQRVTEL